MRRRRRSTMKKERIIMLASSVFVLTALTMTGFYVKEKNRQENDSYLVDMSELEKKTEEKTRRIADEVKKEADSSSQVRENDLDYDPGFQEASSGDVKNLWQNSTGQQAEKQETESEDSKPEVLEKAEEEQESEDRMKTKPEPKEESESQSASVQTAAKALVFREKDNLQWPVAGKVLISYSMDQTIFFPTLQEYKYNPAIIISATEGENISAAADGRVTSVFENEELGQGITMDIGNGYELTYGQLKDIMVLKGDIINAGEVIGTVNLPTKYYSVEGTNVYFKLTKDGIPMNPMSSLE